MNCPVCGTRSMYVVEHAGIELDVCADCQGIWFDAAELDLLLGAEAPRGLPAATAAAEAKRPCPRCRKAMAKANIGADRRGNHRRLREGRLRTLVRSGRTGRTLPRPGRTGWHLDPTF